MNLRNEDSFQDALLDSKDIFEVWRVKFLRTIQIAHIFGAGLLNGESLYRNGLTVHVLIGFLAIAVVAVLLFNKQLKIPLAVAAHGTALCSAVNISIVSLIFWHISVSYTAFLILIPLSMMILFGKKESLIWLGICMVLIVLFEQFNPTFLNLIHYWTKQTVPEALNLIVLMMGSTLVIYLASSMAQVIFNDLVQEKRKLEQAQKKLLETQQLKNRFFSSVSHEIRTPMNAINGIADLMRESNNLDNEERKLIETLHHSAKHLLNIINDLLDIGKLEEGKLQVHYSDFDVRQVLTESVDIVRGAAMEKGLELILDIDENVPQYLYSDPLRLRQCLVNLLSNAVKFTRQGSISLSCDVVPGVIPQSWRCTVHDTGQGIDVQLQDRIFGTYVQGQQNTTPSMGTGLGLNITKGLVELLGGEIWFQSELGIGSTFYITLPIVQRVENQSVALSVHEWPQSIAAVVSMHILIVDDNATNTHIAKKLLHRHIPSAVIDVASNGREALEWVEQQTPCAQTTKLILMDVYMPIMDGLEATRQIRSNLNPHIASIPIMAMTANAAPEDLQACLRAGMNDAIAKPFEISQLLIKIAKLTAKS